MKPSISGQAEVTWIDSRRLKASPRNYNASTCEIFGRVWMAYRSHRMDKDGRCGIAITALDEKSQPADNHWLDLGGATGGEHHEDPRLFLFKGHLHVAYSETTFPKGQAYIAVQKYARLERSGKRWKVAEVFRPRYGRNDGQQMEKNWQFFEHDGHLHAIYQGKPHLVLELDGDKVVREHLSNTAMWPWGEIRGGTPPIPYDDDHYITFFHSSTPEPKGPTWRRYWAGAYLFERKAPFSITAISQRPLLAGSEEDSHGHDPRKPNEWKPLVVFPGGAVRNGDGWRLALGVNDWKIAIATIKDLLLGSTNGAYATRYFSTANGSRPERMMTVNRELLWVEWQRNSKPGSVMCGPGYAAISDPWIAEELEARPGVSVITKEEYDRVFYKAKRG